MNSTLFRFAILPGFILFVVTAIRTPLQVYYPDHPVTPFFTSVVPMFAMTVLWPILLLRRGVSYKQFVAVMLVLLAILRFPVALSYALAWHYQWTEPDGEPVRYIRDMYEADPNISPDMSAIFPFLGTFLFPLVVCTLIGSLIWLIAWAIAFRGKRPLGAAAT